MPDHTTPVVGHFRDRILPHAQPVCYDGCALSSIAQVLELTVIDFHGCLRSIAGIAVHVHGQFAVEEGQLRVLVVGLEHLVDGV